jgi:hypothetical protein
LTQTSLAFIVYSVNFLGTSEVISPSPLDPNLALHTLKLTRVGNVAWIKVDTQPTVGGISPPFLADLNVHSLLYVGQYNIEDENAQKEPLNLVVTI